MMGVLDDLRSEGVERGKAPLLAEARDKVNADGVTVEIAPVLGEIEEVNLDRWMTAATRHGRSKADVGDPTRE